MRVSCAPKNIFCCVLFFSVCVCSTFFVQARKQQLVRLHRSRFNNIQSNIITNKRISSCRALALILTQLHRLVYEEVLDKDNYHLLFTSSTYSAFHKNYSGIISGGNC